jgi:NAD-dependent DNA ligase
MSALAQARQRTEELRSEIERHNYRYYVLDDPKSAMRSTIACFSSSSN